MKLNERIPGEFVSVVTVQEVFASLGVQLSQWAYDIAFTDAAFGEAWALETANRMASISELLHVVYQDLPRRILDKPVVLPDGMVAQIAINPDYRPKATKPPSGDDGDVDNKKGGASSIDDLFPF